MDNALIILAEQTRVERRLVMTTAVVSAMFYLLILGFMCGIFHYDLEAKWVHDTHRGFFDEVPRMSEPEKKQEQLKEVLRHTPSAYAYLHSYWQHVTMGIPLFTLFLGGILSLHRSITLKILFLYHFTFAWLTLCLVLLAILTVIISNSPFIIQGL